MLLSDSLNITLMYNSNQQIILQKKIVLNIIQFLLQ